MALFTLQEKLLLAFWRWIHFELWKSQGMNFYTSICERPCKLKKLQVGLGQELFAGNRSLSKDFKNWGSPFSQYLVVQVCCLSRILGTLWKSVRKAIPVVQYHPNSENKYMYLIQVGRNPTPHTMKCTNRDHLESIYIIYVYILYILYVHVMYMYPTKYHPHSASWHHQVPTFGQEHRNFQFCNPQWAGPTWGHVILRCIIWL